MPRSRINDDKGLHHLESDLQNDDDVVFSDNEGIRLWHLKVFLSAGLIASGQRSEIIFRKSNMMSKRSMMWSKLRLAGTFTF